MTLIVEVDFFDSAAVSFVNWLSSSSSSNDVVQAVGQNVVAGQIGLSFSTGHVPIYATLFTKTGNSGLDRFTLGQLGIIIYAYFAYLLDWSSFSLFSILQSTLLTIIALLAVFWACNIANVAACIAGNKPLLHPDISRRPIDAALYDHERALNADDFFSFNNRFTVTETLVIQINIYAHYLVQEFAAAIGKQILSTILCLLSIQIAVYFALQQTIPAHQLYFTCAIVSVLICFVALDLICSFSVKQHEILTLSVFTNTAIVLFSGYFLIDYNYSAMWFLWSAVCRAIVIFKIRFEERHT